MSMNNVAGLIILSLLLLSCTRIQPFRTLPADEPFACVKDMDAAEPGFSCGIENPSFYRIKKTLADGQRGEASMAVIEFDDQGNLFDPLAYEQIKQQLIQIHKDSGALVILFAHGWRHNADFDPEDGNLRDFSHKMLKLNILDKHSCGSTACQGRHTVGVFLAWRGVSASLEPFESMSFWNRKKAAHRIGQNGVPIVISDLDTIRARHFPVRVPEGEPDTTIKNTCALDKSDCVFTADDNNHVTVNCEIDANSCQEISADGKKKTICTIKAEVRDCLKTVPNVTEFKRINKLVLVGHSFGGAMLYSATQQLMQKDLSSMTNARTVSRTLADLIIIINPAFEASLFTNIFDQSQQLAFSKTQSPILSIFTSKGDGATKKLFKWGRTLSNLFTKYNPSKKEQKELDRTAIGHYSDYITHQLYAPDEVDDFDSQSEQDCIMPSKKTIWNNFKLNQCKYWGNSKALLSDNHPRNNDYMVPYMNISVSADLIQDHSKIWQNDLSDFIIDFIAVQKDR